MGGDAYSFVAAFAEHWKGYGNRYRTFVFVGIGSGLGSGLVLNGQVFHGAGGAAGEIGGLRTHISIQTSIEDELSSAGMLAAAHRFIGDDVTHCTGVKELFDVVLKETSKYTAYIDYDQHTSSQHL